MDDRDKEVRIHVRVDPEGESSTSGEHPAAGIEPPPARPESAPFASAEAEADESDPVIISSDDDAEASDSASEPTVARGRYLELGRENLRLAAEVKKLQSDLYQANARAQVAESKATEQREAVARAQAEFQNFRRRVDREREEAARYANADLLRDLLPVLDNFERAMKMTSAGGTGSLDDFHKGIALIYKQLQDVLANYELRSMDVIGLAFDPNVHEAVTRASHETAPADQVIAEHQKGYYYKDRLLRPALVGVSAGGDGGDEGATAYDIPQEEDGPGTESAGH